MDEKPSAPVGVLIAQVGTPSAPTPKAVQRYLARFLSDQRVVDYPAWLWRPFLRLVVLPRRAGRSAALYQNIWTAEGSPLLAISRSQRRSLQHALGDRYRVALGMAYDGPRFVDAVDELLAEGVEQVVVLPMFPQYSSATTASIYDAVNRAITTTATGALRRFVPATTYIKPYYDEAAYVRALASQVRACLAASQPPDHVVVSFHGLPERYVATGDPYPAQCEHTAALLAREMGWAVGDYTLCYQSRFGREPWLGPETASVLRDLASRGIHRPLIVTPGFTTDCLETLDEIGREGREIFAATGGDPASYQLCPCLNDRPEWIACMEHLVTTNSPI
jgi:protoporphyrin/coproporphyrin ferrochelatase